MLSKTGLGAPEELRMEARQGAGRSHPELFPPYAASPIHLGIHPAAPSSQVFEDNTEAGREVAPGRA